MNKVSGKISDFNLLSEDASRVIIGYELKQVSDTMYEWCEVYIYKKQKNFISFNDIKDAIINDINSQTDEKILTGFVWGEKPVYLSAENQRNFSEGQRMAEKDPTILPITYKIGQHSDGSPVYHTFETSEEIDVFYKQAFGYINQCLNEGWQRKDNIDWSQYEDTVRFE